MVVPDTAVLRHALFGNIEVCHDLDARRERHVHVSRHVHVPGEHAVDPVANHRAVFGGLDVNVRSVTLDRLVENERRHFHHRFTFGPLLDFLNRQGVVALGLLFVLARYLTHGLFEERGAFEKLVPGRAHLRRRGDAGFHHKSGGRFHLEDGVDVEGVADGRPEHHVVATERQALCILKNVKRHIVHAVEVDAVFYVNKKGHAELPCESFVHSLLRNSESLDETLADSHALHTGLRNLLLKR